MRSSNVHKPINPNENPLRPRVNFLCFETSCFSTRGETVEQNKHEDRRIKLRCTRTPVGLWRWPQINDRDARDKITSRIKERRYIPITSTYLRDRFHQVWSTAFSASFSSQDTRCSTGSSYEQPGRPTDSRTVRKLVRNPDVFELISLIAKNSTVRMGCDLTIVSKRRYDLWKLFWKRFSNSEGKEIWVWKYWIFFWDVLDCSESS